MPCLENQAELRTLLLRVRTRHGLSRCAFAPLIGLKPGAYYNFERNTDKKLGADSIRSIGRKLSFSPEIIEAMLSPVAPAVRLPQPDSIRLPRIDPETVMDTMIDLEMAAKMIGAISTAGKALPLCQLLQIAR